MAATADPESATGLGGTRLIAMGSAVLVQGFRLIGFETYADATAQTMEEVLKELVKGRHKALVILEETLFRSPTPTLLRVRREGGHILVVEIPRLQSPEAYHPAVESLVRRVLGPSVLEHEP